MTPGEQVADLQERIRVAHQNRARSELQAQVAEAAATAARAELQRRYGITTVEQAQQLLTRLRAELDDTIVRLEKALGEVET